jgi:hypothetical protein
MKFTKFLTLLALFGSTSNCFKAVREMKNLPEDEVEAARNKLYELH